MGCLPALSRPAPEMALAMNPTSRPDAATAAFRDPLSGDGPEKPPLPLEFSFLEPPVESGDLGQLGKYRVVRVLGQGGMGYVFAAEDTHLRRAVALKVMRPELAADSGFRERFLLEARASAQVASEYVVTVYEVGLAGDVPFIAMQLLNGESLQDRLERDRSLPVNLATLIARQAAEGLAPTRRG
jgi:serine/threonine protein kinase